MRHTVTVRSLQFAAAPALLALTLLAGPALAQGGASAPAAKSAAPARSSPAQRHEEAVESRIKQLHEQMQITDQQAPQWDAFAQVMRDNGTRAGQAFQERAQKLSTMNADDVMKSYTALAQMHADNMQKLSTSFSALYATLSDEQKKTADRLFRQEHGHPHGGGHHGAHMHQGAPQGASTPAPGG